MKYALACSMKLRGVLTVRLILANLWIRRGLANDYHLSQSPNSSFCVLEETERWGIKRPGPQP